MQIPSPAPLQQFADWIALEKDTHYGREIRFATFSGRSFLIFFMNTEMAGSNGYVDINSRRYYVHSALILNAGHIPFLPNTSLYYSVDGQNALACRLTNSTVQADAMINIAVTNYDFTEFFHACRNGRVMRFYLSNEYGSLYYDFSLIGFLKTWEVVCQAMANGAKQA